MEIIIPANSDDGLPLIDSHVSYSPNQLEYLINNSSLFKVLNVSVDKLNNKAKMEVMLVPERVWNPIDYEMERNNLHNLR